MLSREEREERNRAEQLALQAGRFEQALREDCPELSDEQIEKILNF